MKTISLITASAAALLKRGAATTALLLERGSAVDGGTTMLDTSGTVRLSA